MPAIITPAEATGALGALKAAAEISKSLIDAVGAGKLREQAYKLHGEILEARISALAAYEAQTTLKERIGKLEAEIADLKKWDGGAGRYKLQKIGSGALAYVYQGDSDGSKPPHWLCATCFEKRQIGYLVSSGRAGGSHGAMLNVWKCQTCEGEIQVHYTRSPGNEGDSPADPSPSNSVTVIRA